WPLPVRRWLSYALAGAPAVWAMPYPGLAASRGVKPRGRHARGSPGMPPPSNDTIREIVKVLRRHVDAATLEKVVNELLDIPGNRDFRSAIEELARELMRR